MAYGYKVADADSVAYADSVLMLTQWLVCLGLYSA